MCFSNRKKRKGKSDRKEKINMYVREGSEAEVKEKRMERKKREEGKQREIEKKGMKHERKRRRWKAKE